MKTLGVLAGMALALGTLNAQFDPDSTKLVYQTPDMGRVKIVPDIVFTRVDTMALKVDLYYPPSWDGQTSLPAVVFFNSGNLHLYRWGGYRDWARLVASHGMIGILYQSKPFATFEQMGETVHDAEALVAFLRNHQETGVDIGRLGLWASSGNVTSAMDFVQTSEGASIKAFAIHYGMSNKTIDQFRRDLPVFYVKCGWDNFMAEQRGDAFVTKAVNDWEIPFQFVYHPTGQHAYDVLDNDETSRSIIRQNIEFYERHLKFPVQERPALTAKTFYRMLASGDTARAFQAYVEARNYVLEAAKVFSPAMTWVINWNGMGSVGQQLIRDGKLELGTEVLRRNFSVYPHPQTAMALAQALDASNRRKEAVELANKALELLSTSLMPPFWKEQVRRNAETLIGKER